MERESRMSVQLNPYIEQLSWAEARELILPVNPDFVRHTDDLELPAECCIFKVRYRYGDYLLKNSAVHLRSKTGANVPIGHEDLPKIINEKLSYAPSIPMGINLDKRIEILYKSIDGRIIPVVVTKPGYIFALTGALSESHLVIDQGFFWNMTAGARSVYSAPKISLGLNHRKIAREYGVGLEPPKSLAAQWEFFSELLQTPKLENEWELNVLYFSDEWFKTETSWEWSKFQTYLRKYVWNNSTFLRNLYQASYIFSQSTALANIKCNPNIISAMKHIFYIAGEFMPGLSFDGDEEVFPRKILTDIYENIYGLEYLPQFVTPGYFDPTKDISIYHSLSLPTQLEYYSENTPHKSKFDELRDLAYALKKITGLFSENQFGIRDIKQSIFRGMANANIKCYHTHTKGETNIESADELLKHGLKNDSKKACHASILSRGLVGIHKK